MNLGLNLSPVMGGVMNSPKANVYTYQDFTKPVHLVDTIESFDKIINDFDVIIDTRPYNNYQQFHMRSAINICIPTTLLKRNSMTVHSLLNIVNFPPSYKQMLIEQLNDKNPQQKIKILFYDSSSTDKVITFSLFQTVEKFLCFERCFEVSLLNGGFDKVTKVLGLTQPTPEEPMILPDIFSPAELSAVSAKTPVTGECLSGFVLPSATDPHTQFVNEMKKNFLVTDTSNYHHKFALPAGIDSTSELTDIPPWLASNVTSKSDKEIIAVLNSKFVKIETIETVRLKSLIEAKPRTYHNSPVCTPSGLCPDCDQIKYELPRGIELGYKNRYKNIWPYEHSRVKLGCESCCDSDDYFNANFINVKSVIPTSQCRYIATQNPLDTTVNDFWTSVNSQEVKIIIDLDSTPAQYLNPQPNGFVESTKEMSRSESLVVTLINDEIYHFQYMQWPDFGVPTNFDSLFELIQMKNAVMAKTSCEEKERPTVMVHCLAGCGRTGVFITIDALVDCFNHDYALFVSANRDLIYQVVHQQRTQRISMVQNLKQYVVCYELMVHFLLTHDRSHQLKSSVSLPTFVTSSRTSGREQTKAKMISPKAPNHIDTSKRITPFASAEGCDYFTYSSV
ncbi:hypothetical protein DICA4_B09164 [Diutina catenulata]